VEEARLGLRDKESAYRISEWLDLETELAKKESVHEIGD
jgi:hypothetical protein